MAWNWARNKTEIGMAWNSVLKHKMRSFWGKKADEGIACLMKRRRRKWAISFLKTRKINKNSTSIPYKARSEATGSFPLNFFYFFPLPVFLSIFFLFLRVQKRSEKIESQPALLRFFLRFYVSLKPSSKFRRQKKSKNKNRNRTENRTRKDRIRKDAPGDHQKKKNDRCSFLSKITGTK